MFRKETMMYLYFAEQSIFSLGFSITSYKMTVFLLGEEFMVQAKRDENVLISILMNIVLPSLVLTKGTAYLGADRALALGIALPIGYFAWDYYARRETSMMSLLGLASVIASGALGMFRATGLWFAIKEALLPSVLGLATLMSLSWRKPLIHAFVYSDMIFHKDRIEQALSEKGTDKVFLDLLKTVNLIVAGSFLVSAVLNFALAIWLIKSEPGTEAFNSELGKMNALSFPVIALPSMVILAFGLLKLSKGLEKLTGLSSSELMKSK
jgi:intracellular septation protein A